MLQDMADLHAPRKKKKKERKKEREEKARKDEETDTYLTLVTVPDLASPCLAYYYFVTSQTARIENIDISYQY